MACDVLLEAVPWRCTVGPESRGIEEQLMAKRTGSLITALAICTLAAVLGAHAAFGAPGASVMAWEGAIQIPTYLLGPADPNPAFPLVERSPVYPYTMMDSLTDHRVLKTYRAIFLENRYLKLTILPQLGGHLYSIYDKIDHREVLYRNHVVKYGLVGPRGAWISGGIEFSFPFAHTDVTVSPVESTLLRNADGSATAIVGAIDRVSNMHWEVALTLRPGDARVEQRVTLFNSTPLAHLYLFWANAAVKATDDMQYIYPMRETISDDPFAPAESWPVRKGVDRSWYKNIPSALAIFARASHRNYFGVYYHASNFGVVHVANFRQDPGKKLWSWGTADSGLIWAHILSDSDGPYSEIQSGRFYTQGYREFMPLRRVEQWTEYWYPVRGLDGGFVQVSRGMALNVVYSQPRAAPQVTLLVSPAAAAPNATVVVKLGEKTLREFANVNFTPLRTAAFNVSVPSVAQAKAQLSVTITGGEAAPILRWSAAEPVDGNPDFEPAGGPQREQPNISSQTPVEELYLHGVFLEQRGDLNAALKVYGDVLWRDPGYIPALLKLAWNAYGGLDLAPARDFIQSALARDDENPRVLYAEGVIERAQGRLTRAQNAFWASIHYGGHSEPSLVELGEIAIHRAQYAAAARLLERAVSYEPGDALARADLAAALRLAGRRDSALKASAEAVREMPLLPFALAEQWLDGVASTEAATSSTDAAWEHIAGADPDNFIAVAAWYHRLGDWRASDAVLNAAVAHESNPSPMLYYYLASNARSEGDQAHAATLAQKAASMPVEGMFPQRVTDAKVLEEAVAHNPRDAHAKYALGNFLFAHGRYNDANSHWLEALNEGFSNPVLLRNLGLYAWRVKLDLQTAARYYSRAIRLDPAAYRLYNDLDKIYALSDNTPAEAALFRSAPAGVLAHETVQARYALFLLEHSKFGQALAVLRTHTFRPWEGGVEIHEMFARANIEMGKELIAGHHPGGEAEAAAAFRAAMEYPRNLEVGMPAHPSDEEPLYWLGVALEAQGQPAAAQSAWKRAAEGADTRGVGAVFAALALAKLGQPAESRSILARLAQTPTGGAERPYNFLVAGLAARYQGDALQARKNFLHALALNPLFWQARVALNSTARDNGAQVSKR